MNIGAKGRLDFHLAWGEGFRVRDLMYHFFLGDQMVHFDDEL